ncbi:MAG: 50S ribosome-binding GTPase [Pirellulales bacterium]|nr:50S ribosome-binding GTPase [Pirellulales bacterium]
MSGAPSAGRASVLTHAGRGAVAVVAAAGQGAVAAVDASFHAANGRPVEQQKRHRIIFGHWTSGEHREEVVLLRGEGDALEVHCHGGAAAVKRILAAFDATGCEVMPWQAWIEGESFNEKAREASMALAAATTRRTAAILLDQLNGALEREIAAARQELSQGNLTSAQDRLAALLAFSHLGNHLTHPWQVAIAGRPNVGKSSLINALVGYQRAIVFDQPGTTRDVLSADTAIDGWPVRFTDAAGIRATTDPLEAEGVSRARQQLAKADLVLWVLDASAIPAGCDVIEVAMQELTDEGGEIAKDSRPLVVLNKIDVLECDRPASHPSAIAVSALVGLGLVALLAAIADRLVPTPLRRGEAVPFTARQALVLESALLAIHQVDAQVAVAHLDDLARSASKGAKAAH